MDLLKKVFPLSFTKKNDVAALVINILIYIVGAIIAGVVLWIASKIPVVNIVVGILGTIVEVYIIAGIVLSCLDYFQDFEIRKSNNKKRVSA